MNKRIFKVVTRWLSLLQTPLLLLVASAKTHSAERDQLLLHHGGTYISDTRSLVNLNSSISWNNKIYYAGQSAIFGNELWMSDGSDDGTKMIADIAPLSANSDPRNFTATQNYLYFIVNNHLGKQTICRIDKNDQLTILQEINIGKVLQTRAVGEKIFFNALTNTGNLYHAMAALYMFNPQSSTVDTIGTYRINSAYETQIWTVLGESLYLANGYAFQGYYANSIERPKIWKTSGVAGDLAEFHSATLATATDGETWNGSSYYIAGMENGKNGLWRLNQSTGNPELVLEFPDAVTTIYPRPLSFNAGALYFVAANSSSSYSLWRSDGTGQGTISVDPRVIVTSQHHLAKVNGHLFYLQFGAKTNVNQLMRIEADQEIGIVSIVPEAIRLEEWNDQLLVIASTTGVYPSYDKDVAYYLNSGFTDENKKLLSYSTINSRAYSGSYFHTIKTKDHLYYNRSTTDQYYSYYKFTTVDSSDEQFTARDHTPLEAISFDQARKELGKEKNLDEKIEVTWDDPSSTKYRGMLATLHRNEVYMVNRKNEYIYTGIYLYDSERIEGVKQLQGWFCLLVYNNESNSYKIYRWRSPHENAWSNFSFYSKPKIYTHEKGLIFIGSAMLVIPKGNTIMPQYALSISNHPPIVIGGRIYYLSYDGSIRHNDFNAMGDQELIILPIEKPPIRASSITSHGNRLLFTSFINGVDQLVHSYPLKKSLNIQSKSFEFENASYFNSTTYQNTYLVKLNSTVGSGQISAQIHGPHAKHFKIIGETEWDRWSPNATKSIVVEYTPKNYGEHKSELVFTDLCSNVILSKIQLFGYVFQYEHNLTFSHANGSTIPLVNEPILVKLKPIIPTMNHISKVLVYTFIFEKDTYKKVLLTESSEPTFFLPPQENTNRFISIVAIDEQGQVIMEKWENVTAINPYKDDSEARTFESLLGQSSYLASESGHFLLQQNFDQSFSYQIKFGSTTSRGKGRFDENGATEIDLNASRSQKITRVHLQKSIDPYTMKPFLIPIFGTKADWQIPDPITTIYPPRIHYRDPSAVQLQSLQGKKFAVNLVRDWFLTPYLGTKGLTSHSGFYGGFLNYGYDGDATITLQHFKKKNLRRKLTPLSDGSLIFYHSTKNFCLSYEFYQNSAHLKRYRKSEKSIASSQYTTQVSEVPITPYSAPFFYPYENENYLSCFLSFLPKQEYVKFDTIPQEAKVKLKNEIGALLNYQIHQDGKVTGIIHSSGRTLSFSGFYFTPDYDYRNSPEIHGILYRDGKYHGDISFELW